MNWPLFHREAKLAPFYFQINDVTSEIYTEFWYPAFSNDHIF